MRAINQLKQLYAASGNQTGKMQQRLGQFFTNSFLYITDKTTEALYYMPNDAEALELIRKWLVDNGHETELPWHLASRETVKLYALVEHKVQSS